MAIVLWVIATPPTAEMTRSTTPISVRSSSVQAVADRAATTTPPLLAPPPRLLQRVGMMVQEDITKNNSKRGLTKPPEHVIIKIQREKEKR
jgi:hypothetical protein